MMTFDLYDGDNRHVGEVTVRLPTWRCWYDNRQWRDDRKVTEPVKLRKGAFGRVDRIAVTFRPPAEPRLCRGAGASTLMQKGTAESAQ
jgi:hypothetical protein